MPRERELKVKILGDSKGAEASLDRTAKATGRLDGALEKTGKATGGLKGLLSEGLSSGAAIGAAALAGIANAAVQAASDLSEQISAVKQTFGAASQAILDFGKSAASSLGISNRAALEAANQFGDLFQNVGVSEQNAAKFSTQLVRLAADLASFKNLDPADVLQRLQSGLVGETEPLRRLGIVINEAAVSAKAMELGIASASGEVSEGAKVQARYALILEKTDRAQGDVARTSESLANKQRRLNAEFEDTKARLGEKLIPAVGELVDQVDRLTNAQSRNKDIVRLGLFEYERSAGNLEKLGQIIFGVKDKTDRQAEAYEKLTKETAQQAAATQTLQEKEKLTAEAHREAAEAAKAHASAIGDVLDASQSLIGSQLGVAEAVDRLRDSQADTAAKEKALADAISAHGRSSQEAAEAAEEVEDARRGQLGAIDALAKAHQTFAVQQAAAAGKTLSDAEKYDAYRTALINVKNELAPGSPLRQHLEGLVNQLPSKEVKFAVIADTTQADASLERLRQQFLAFNKANPGAVGPSLFGPVGGSTTINNNVTVNAKTDAKGEDIARELTWRGRGWDWGR